MQQLAVPATVRARICILNGGITANILTQWDSGGLSMDNTTNINFIIGQNLKSLRKNRGLTQKDLADRLNQLGRKTWNVSISQYESGKTAISYEMLVDLARILECNVSDITGCYDNDRPKMIVEALRSAAAIIENHNNNN